MTRILIADDDEDLRVLAGLLFTPPEWNVTLAEDGATAIAALERSSFEVLVLDIDMPEHTGIEVARHARTTGHTGPVVLWSGWIQTTDATVLDELDAVAVEKVDVTRLIADGTALVGG